MGSSSKTQWQWKLLRAGQFRLDGGAMFGIIPRTLWARLVTPDDLNRIPLQTNCVLLDNGKRKVLIETGYGNKFDAKNRQIFDLEDRWIDVALREVGVNREDITDIVVTHLHFDHGGGLVFKDGPDSSPQSSFPNARIFAQETEWMDALANKSTMSRTYLRENLDPIKDQVTLLRGAAEPIPGISVLPLIGHTWGQQGVIFKDAKGTLVFPGDVMPTVNHVGLPYNMGYDVLPFDNMHTKATLLDQCAEEDWRIIIDHEPGWPVVEVRKPVNAKPGQFELVRTDESASR